MEIINREPPNIKDIKAVFNKLPESQIFAYGNKIYNSSKQEIPPDIQMHETVHIEQMKVFPHPDVWWTRYLLDKSFRLEEELEAFSAQLQFIKKFYPNKAMKEALNEMAENLSGNYKLGITRSQAETMIRKYDNNNKT